MQKLELGYTTEDGNYRLCCLGQGLLTLHELKGTEPDLISSERNKDNRHLRKNRHMDLCDVGLTEPGKEQIVNLQTSFKQLGLFNPTGRFKEPVGRYISLTKMNDANIRWSAIANYIEDHPENVFEKSV